MNMTLEEESYRSFVHLLVRSFICSFVRSFARSFVRLSPWSKNNDNEVKK
jgi:hypothetical protein